MIYLKSYFNPCFIIFYLSHSMEKETQQTTEATQEQENEKKKDDSVNGLIPGIAFFAIAYYFFITMTDYENGEEIEMYAILLIVYKLLGKTVTTVIMGLIGALFSYSGIKDIMKKFKSKKD